LDDNTGMKIVNFLPAFLIKTFQRHNPAVGVLLAVLLAFGAPSLVQGETATIEAAPLETVVSFPTRESFAEVVALNESRLAAEAAGVVRQWYADVGASVKAGDLLLSLDDRDASLALSQAQAATGAMKARVDLAESHLQRARELSATGFVSKEALSLRQTELTVAIADLASAQAQTDLAGRQLEKMQLLAPFDGVIIERHAQIGESLAAGALAFVLIDPLAVEVQGQLSAEQIASLKNARQVEALMAGKTYPLRLLRVSPVAVLPSRTQSVRLGFRDPQRPVAGVTGQLRWQINEPLLSTELLVRRNDALGIFTLQAQGDRWVARFVTLKNAQEGRPAPAPKLDPKTLIVFNGQQRLQDGQILDRVDISTRSN
jgi:RND family efflux transporter MFP subunit